MKKHENLHDRKPVIGLDDSQLKISVDVLNNVLAAEFVVLVQTLNYHWNIIGAQFHDYHKLFDEQYRALFGFLDDIAERVRAVGGIAVASMHELVQISSLKEDTGNIPEPIHMVENLLKQHEALIQIIRTGINQTVEDAGTSNFLTDLIEKHEKMAWMLRSLSVR